MLIYTHLLGGLVLSLILILNFNISNPFIFLITLCIFTVIPDIDSHKSKVGKNTFPLSIILELFFSHRGFIHTIWPPLFIFFIFWYFGYTPIGFAAMLGYLLHILMDSLTLGGVNLFGFKKYKAIIKTGGFFEKVFAILLVVILVRIILFHLL